MIKAPRHPREDERLQAVLNLGILDTPPDPRFDVLTKEAVERLRVPISTVSILDKNREWFRSCQGTLTSEGPREISFCGHALLAPDLFVVRDTLEDVRFKDNPYVIGPPFVRFYAGSALRERMENLPLGVFCVKDIKPRALSLGEIAILLDLAARAEKLLNL